jgi:hypothetical protein
MRRAARGCPALALTTLPFMGRVAAQRPGGVLALNFQN